MSHRGDDDEDDEDVSCLCRSDGLRVQHLLLLQLPQHGSVQRVQEGPGGLRRLLESGNGQFWCEGAVVL